jgi:hypothetical protein
VYDHTNVFVNSSIVTDDKYIKEKLNFNDELWIGEVNLIFKDILEKNILERFLLNLSIYK